MTDKLYMAQLAYKRLLIKGNDQSGVGMTVRPIYAKDLDQAKKRLENYWRKKYPGFVMVKLEIYEAIDQTFD